MIILKQNEDRLIDSYAPQTDNVSPRVTQADNPGENLMNVGGDTPPPLPSPTVGGQNGSGFRNGFSTGFRSFASRFARFNGAMAKLPAISNPVQGTVGTNNREGSLYMGVMNQQVQYSPDQSVLARQITGVGGKR